MAKWHISKLHKSIMDRCYNPKNALYPRYGAKGITVCDEWHDCETFKKWIRCYKDYQQGYVKRIDPSQGYSPLNCKIEKYKGGIPNSRVIKRKTKRVENGIRNQVNVGATRKTQSPLWTIWIGIKQRCQNPNNSNYPRYGARGIEVCDEWCGENGFERFCQWAFSNGWKKGLTIDRIDVNGNYEPENCRWISKGEQAKNRRCNRYYSYNNSKMLISEIAEMHKLTYSVLYSRIVQKGMTPEQAVEDCLNKGLGKKA